MSADVRKVARATAAALEHVVSGRRCGASLDGVCVASPAAVPLPPDAAGAPLLAASYLGTTFTLHAALLSAKAAALLQAARGQPLVAAFAGVAAVPAWPVAAGGRLPRPRALSAAEAAEWAAPHAAALAGLLHAVGAAPGGEGAGAGELPQPACGCGSWERAGPRAARWREGAPGGCAAAHAQPCPVALCGVLLDYPVAYDLAWGGGGGVGAGNCLAASPLLVFEGPWAFSVPEVCADDERVAEALAAWRAALSARGAAAWAPPARKVRTKVVC